MKRRMVAAVLTLCIGATILPTGAAANSSGIEPQRYAALDGIIKNNSIPQENNSGGIVPLEDIIKDNGLEENRANQAITFGEGKNKAPVILLANLDEDVTYSQTLLISDGNFSDIQTALDSLLPEVNGAVLIQIDKDIVPPSEAVYSVPTEKGITSLTIGTTQPDGVTVGQYGSFYFFANGVPIVIDSGVTFEGNLFGGGEQRINSGTSITVKEGASVTGSIYGGGKNADVIGNVSIVVNGSAWSVYGGGYAYAFTKDKELDRTANVAGNVEITLAGPNSFLSRNLVGGGYVYAASSEEAVQTFHADVDGDIKITLDSPNMSSLNKVIGGGYAYLSSAKNNRALNADVTGDIQIKIGSETRGVKYNDWIELYGGGHADSLINVGTVLENTSVSASVGKNITIDASGDALAADPDNASPTDDWDGAMFKVVYGGGYASGLYTKASVGGDTYVDTVRKAANSDLGVFGGGGGVKGGEAIVEGNTTVYVHKALDQVSNHDNGKGVVGGGNAGYYGNATVKGNTRIIIGDGVSFEGNNGIGIVGGGRVTQEYGAADVLGNVTLEIGNDVTVPSSHAIVGGGCVYRYHNASANVAGNITAVVKEGLSSKSMFVGGGYLYSTSAGASSAQVGTGEHPSKISISFEGTSADSAIHINSNFFGGGYVSGAGKSASVYGDVEVSFTNIQLTGNTKSVGGYCSSDDSDATVYGNTALTVKNSNTDNILFTGGFGKNAVVTGNTTTTVEGSTCDTVYGGGYSGSTVNDTAVTISGSTVKAAYAAGYNADVHDANITVSDSTLSGLRGSYGSGITGSATVNLLGDCNLLLNGGGTLTDGMVFNVGDGSTKTNAVVWFMYDTGVKEVHIFKDATLWHPSNADYSLFYGNSVKNLQIDPGGLLRLEKFSENITGSFTGGGTLRMLAGNSMTIQGTVSGQSGVEIIGTPQVDEVYIQAADGSTGDFTLNSQGVKFFKTSQNGSTQWKIINQVMVSVSEPLNGSIDPAGSVVVAPGEQQTFTFQPDYGYKLGPVQLDGVPVTDDIVDNTYTMTVTKDCTLSAEFIPLELEDINRMIDSLPAQADTEAERNSVLDAKLNYEALSEIVKGQVAEEKLSALNAALNLLPNVDVLLDVQVEDQNAVSVPDLTALLQAMTAEEALALRENTIQDYKIIMTAQNAGELSGQQAEALNASLNGAVPAKQFDISVNKIITEKEQAAETIPVTELAAPVTLVFNIADTQADEGYVRNWSVLNLHGSAEAPTVTALQSANTENQTLTVKSSQFSVYTLAYLDNGVKLSVSNTANGSVDPAGDIILMPGQTQDYTFKADYGYKLGSVKLDDIDVTDEVVNNTYLVTATKDSTLSAEFIPLELEDINGMIDSLPAQADTEAERNSVLDAKLNYEALSEIVKGQVAEEKLSALNAALNLLPNVDVLLDVQVEDQNAVSVPDLTALLQAMTAEEALALRENTIQDYKIIMTAQNAGELSGQQAEALNASLNGAVPAKQFDISVNKIITEKEQAAETIPVTELAAPVTLVFNIADTQADEGYVRNWSVLNLHGSAEAPTVTALQSANTENQTLTVKSSQFSVYTLAYLDNGVKISVSDTKNGSVEPSGDVVVTPGGQQIFTFKSDYGYKLGTVKLDGVDVTGDVINNTYTMTASKDSILSVEYVQLSAPDIGNIIEELPKLSGEELTEEEKDTILDTKLDYEALPEGTKEQVSEEKISELNKALEQLPNIGVEVQVQVDDSPAASVPDPHMLLQAMTAEEAEKLKVKDIQEYKLSLTITKASELSAEQQASLASSLNGAKEGKQYEITVQKHITENGQTANIALTELQNPVTLVFDVSDQLPASGYERKWTVLNIHGEAGKPTVTVMNDMDNADETVTVSSSRFSVYILAYQDTKTPGSTHSGVSKIYYTITAKAGAGGTIDPEGGQRIARGSSTTFSFTPDEGYKISDVLVDGESIGAVDSYTFESVMGNHTVEALFEKQEENQKPEWNPFTDVSSLDWFHDSVKYVYEQDLMTGTSKSMFSPMTGTSRGMIVTVLWRLEGQPQPGEELGFADVKPGEYYTEAVRWANENSIVEGYGNGLFGPDDLITREQMAVILYRYGGYKGYDVSKSVDLFSFTDANTVSDWASEPVKWSVASALIEGKGNGVLDPKGLTARAEAAALLKRFCENIAQ